MSMLKNSTNFALTVTEVTNCDSVYGICLCVYGVTSLSAARTSKPNTLEITLTHCYK